MTTRGMQIGTYFDKSKIVLATISKFKPDDETVKPKEELEDLIALLLVRAFIMAPRVDIFYQNENGKYIRFTGKGQQILYGDNSDQKGYITNVVPVWNYYREEQLREYVVNDQIMIARCDNEPLERYNMDYNVPIKH